MSKNFALNDERVFRPEIEGLRAVAATLVMVYHIFLDRVSGGVDVFFLIAGFLITGSLLRQVEKSGTIQPGAFLTRLGRRLLPNALTVLIVVMIGTHILIPITQRVATFREIFASTLYFENWALIAKATDYLASEEIQSPVQHFWAMSIQGQFYLIWLLVFGIALLFGAHRIRKTLGVALALLFVFSFAFSVYYTSADQPVAYFHTGTRVWEFAAGGLFALISAKIPRIPEPVRVVFSWVGLLAIVFLGVTFSVGSSFPGYIALVPVTGALLVLLAGPSQSRWSATKILGSRPLTYLGGVSYGLYLWHWPILIFYKHYTGREVIGPRSGIAIMVLSLILAILSTKFIETPLRGKRPTKQKSAHSHRKRVLRPATIALLCVSAVSVSAAFAGKNVGAGHPKFDAEALATDYPGAMARVDADWDAADHKRDPYPDLLSITESKPLHYENGCHQNQRLSDIIECEIGAEGDEVILGTPTIAVIGGSHSAHWIPTISEIAKSHGWKATSMTKSACLFSTDPPTSQEALPSCLAFNEKVLAHLEESPPDLVIMTSTRGRAEDEHVPDGYLERWRELKELDIEVLAIRDNPRSKTNWLDCLAKNMDDHTQCDQPRSELLSPSDPVAALESQPENVHFVDFSDIFCDEDVCSGVIGNTVVYRDAHHLTEEFATSFAPLLEEEILAALDEVIHN